MTESTGAMLTIAIDELEAATDHALVLLEADAATSEQVAEAIARTERAARLLRCVADLERIDAEERERRDEARRLAWDGERCSECGKYGVMAGLCETCRHDHAAAPVNHSTTPGLSYSL